MKLLERLRQRKVIQWGVAYLAAAWIVVQVVGLLTDTYGWSPLIMRALPIVLAAGFATAVIVAWYHGEKGQQRVTGPELIMIAATLVMASVAIWWARSSVQSNPDAEAVAEPALVDPRSVAVLPFANASPDSSNAYFAEGLTDELISALNLLEGVKVAARTSSFAFRERTADVREIGNKLQVAHVVEGTVRKAEQRLRISVQLINVANGYTLWSQVYNRELLDVFSIQEEIARKVAEALRARLSGAESAVLARRPTDNFEAYELYLLGRSQWNARTPVSIAKSIQSFRRAAELDPNYAHAYAGLADAYLLQGLFALERGSRVYRLAEANARKALELNPSLAEAHSSLAMTLAHTWRLKGAEEHFLRAIELDPRFATAAQWYSAFLAVLGRWTEADQQMLRARSLEPLSLGIITDLARNAHLQGRTEQAILYLDQALKIDSTFARTHGNLGIIRIQQGRFDDAIRSFEKAIELAGGWYPNRWGTPGLARAYAAKGDTARARAILRELKGSGRYVGPDAYALIHAALGEYETALKELIEAADASSIVLTWELYEPALARVRALPGFEVVRKKLEAAKQAR